MLQGSIVKWCSLQSLISFQLNAAAPAYLFGIWMFSIPPVTLVYSKGLTLFVSMQVNGVWWAWLVANNKHRHRVWAWIFSCFIPHHKVLSLLYLRWILTCGVYATNSVTSGFVMTVYAWWSISQPLWPCFIFWLLTLLSCCIFWAGCVVGNNKQFDACAPVYASKLRL